MSDKERVGFSIYKNDEMAGVVCALAAQGLMPTRILDNLKAIYGKKAPSLSALKGFIKNYLQKVRPEIIQLAVDKVLAFQDKKKTTKNLLVEDRANSLEYYKSMLETIENILVQLMADKNPGWEDTAVKLTKELRSYRMRIDTLEGLDDSERLKNIVLEVYKISLGFFSKYVPDAEHKKVIEGYYAEIVNYAQSAGIPLS